MQRSLLAKASAISIALCLAPGAALAQANDEIVVTGSFIKRQNQADLPSPLQTVDAASIDAIGAQNIGDITQTLTINTGAQNNPDAFTQNATVGTSNINLRGLGVGSTLVLLNGKRQVLSAASTNDGISFVDTNSLVPMIAINRVEILKDGASALYGSDAVAGVVNFITREDYTGFVVSGDFTTHASEGDYDEYNIQALGGYDFGRGSVVAAFSYTDRSPLTTDERRLSRPQDDTSALGNPGAFFGFPGLPAGTPLIDPGCADAGGFPTPLGPTIAPGLTVGLCGFDFGSFFNLVAEEERYMGYARAEFDLTDNINWSAEFSYADNTASRGNSPTFPVLTLGSAVVPGAAFGPNANPFNIFPGDPNVVFFGRASGNGGSVSFTRTESETWRFSTAIEGQFGDTGGWEISYTRANNSFDVRTPDTVADRFQCALSGFNSVPEIAGVTGGTDCTSANPNLTSGGASIPATGTFFNPFSTSLTGVAPNDPALLAYTTADQLRSYESDLNVIEGYVTMPIFEMPAGDVSVAVGAQYRDNDLSQVVDPLSLADAFSFLVGGRDFEGSQDVLAFFAEASVPVADWMDLQLAVRHERYGDDEGGSTTDPKIAVLIRPTDSVSFRGSFSTSFRAPSVFQQFGESTTLQQVSDPLNGGANAFVAVRTLAPSDGSGGATARDISPEQSEAFNFGMSFRPEGGFQFDIDYYSFDFSDVLIQTAPQALLNADPSGSAIIRAPSGTIIQINNDFVNASTVETAGLDISASYPFETSSWGTFTPSVTLTHIINYDIEDPQAGGVNGAGQRNFTNFGSPAPDFRFNIGLGWENGVHSANAFLRHIGQYDDDQNGGATIEGDTRIDLQYSLALNELLNRDQLTSLTVGARNITGQRPPPVATNGGFDSRVHDPRGALFYVGLDVEF